MRRDLARKKKRGGKGGKREGGIAGELVLPLGGPLLQLLSVLIRAQDEAENTMSRQSIDDDAKAQATPCEAMPGDAGFQMKRKPEAPLNMTALI